MVKHNKVMMALTVALAGAAAPAWAAKGAEALTSDLAGPIGSPALAPAATSTVVIDVTGRRSFDGRGAAINDLVDLNIGAGAEVIGIGWDVTLTGIDPSYQSEIAVGFGSSVQGFVNLRPGIAATSPGTGAFSSGGVLDLIAPGLNFSVGDDGVLRLEFFETFDDAAGELDGTWDSGTITLQLAAVVPEPTTYGMMALGLLGVAAAARRSRRA